MKTILTLLFLSLCSQGACETVEERVSAVEEAVADLEISPRTTKDSLVAVLNETWPTVPHTLSELLEQARKHEKIMDRLDNKAESLMEKLNEVSYRSTENQKINFRQDSEISSLQKEQLVIVGRQDKIEGTWAGVIKGSILTIAGAIVSIISGIIIFIARAGLLKKIFVNKKLDRRAKEELVK